MKKILSVSLAAMLLAIGMPAVFAEETPAGDPSTMKVQYGVNSQISMSVPSGTVGIGPDNDNEGTANFTMGEGTSINDNEKIIVRVSGSDYVNRWEMISQDRADAKIEYKISLTSGGANLENNGIIYEGTNADKGVAKTVYFRVEEGAADGAYPGLYEDTLTFQVYLVTP